MGSKLFSIVVPVYQNSANLSVTMTTLLQLQQQLPGWGLELVFVDDGSTDNSSEMLLEFFEANPTCVRVVTLTRNFGQNPAIQAGLRYAQGDCVGIISADLQEPYELFVKMVQKWEQGAKFVIGERQEREDGSWFSEMYWWLIRRVAFPDLPDIGYDFCLLDKQVVEDVNKINEKNSPVFILLYWLGYRPVRLPIVRRAREKGRSQWRFGKKIHLAIDTLIGFTYIPARAITLMGFSISILCLLYLVLIVAHWYSFYAAPPGWMTVVGFVVFLGAMILFALGIVSEYLLRILDEARKRPPFVVDTVTGPLMKEQSNQNSIDI